MDMLQKALEFATAAHSGQVRKYTGEPYVNHCIEVVKILMHHGYCSAENENMLCAAMLHDTVEDTDVTFQDIKAMFGDRVMHLVFFVTDVVGKEQGNRATVIDLNSHHIISTPYTESLIIKCADIISNTSSIVERDPKFAPIYLDEKNRLLSRMQALHPWIKRTTIWCRAYATTTLWSCKKDVANAKTLR